MYALMKVKISDAQVLLQKQTSVMSAKAFLIFKKVETFSPFVYSYFLVSRGV